MAVPGSLPPTDRAPESQLFPHGADQGRELIQLQDGAVGNMLSARGGASSTLPSFPPCTVTLAQSLPPPYSRAQQCEALF